MKIKRTFLALLFMIFIVACKDKDFIYLNKQANQKEQGKELFENGVILKKRDSSSPLILSKKQKHSIRTRANNNQLYSFVGRSLKIQELPLTDHRNFGWQVIDLKNYLKDYPNSYHYDPIRTSENKDFAYTNFDRYLEKSTINKKVKKGFSLNLGLFSLGAKRTMSNTFSKTEINEQNRVFGESYYIYKAGSHRLKNSTEDIKNMKNYIVKSFSDDLYNIPLAEFFDMYGSFVLCDFIVGGKAFALYSGRYLGQDNISTKEKNMRTDINASFGFPIKGIADTLKGNVNYGYGKNYSNGKESSKKITDLKISIKTLGGIGAIGSYTSPQSLGSINLNLNNWLSSLNNESTHCIIDISDNGLIPITAFIKETNFKYYISTRRLPNSFKEPKLIYVHSQRINWEILSLRTRYDETICLYSGKYINQQYSKNLQNKYASQYKIELVDLSIPLELMLEKKDPISDNKSGEKHKYFNFLLKRLNVLFDNNPSLKKVVGGPFKKYIHDGTIFLISQQQGVNFAYSINNDYILDTYGIRDWVANMKSTKTNDLSDYTIIAL